MEVWILGSSPRMTLLLNNQDGIPNMILTDEEKALLDGSEGLARQKAMELLVRYGEALGAERLVDTNNVCVSVTAGAYSTAKPATG